MQLRAMFPATAIAVALAGMFTTAEGNAQEAEKQLAAALKGTWQMVSRIEDGVAADKELVSRRTITVADGKYTVRDASKVITEATFKLDPSKKPAWFDVTYPGDDGKTVTERGVIKVEGDTLTFCLAAPGAARATEFRSAKGDDHLLVAYKRVKK
jgi:uncharacterized protein (TIGR03067 family)